MGEEALKSKADVLASVARSLQLEPDPRSFFWLEAPQLPVLVEASLKFRPEWGCHAAAAADAGGTPSSDASPSIAASTYEAKR